jgi:hypothetical protein
LAPSSSSRMYRCVPSAIMQVMLASDTPVALSPHAS